MGAASELGQDRGSAFDGGLLHLEDQDPRPFSHDKPVVGVERARSRSSALAALNPSADFRAAASVPPTTAASA